MNSPANTDINGNLKPAIEFIKRGEFKNAESPLTAALKLDATHPLALYCMGVVHKETNRLETAERFLLASLEANPAQVQVYMDLISVQIDLQKYSEAIESCDQVLKLQPENSEILLYKSNAYLKLRRYDDAIRNLDQVLKVKPNDDMALWLMAYSLFAMDRIQEASEYSLKALQINPNLQFLRLFVAFFLKDHEKLYEKPIQLMEEEVKLYPNSDRAYRMLAACYSDFGDIEKAIELTRKQIEVAPDNQNAHNNLVMYLHYDPKVSAQDIFAAADDYYRSIFPKIASNKKPKYDFGHLDLDPDKKTLRIAFVSGDFKGHAVFYYIKDLFSRLSDMNYEVYAYCNNVEDEMSEKLKSQVQVWRNIKYTEIEEVLDLVKEDKIDVLVDLAGHTYLNRLELFAYKPAPLQITWLGQSGPLGLPQIDYMIGDSYMVREGEEHLYGEKVYKMPNSYAPFYPESLDVEIKEAPFKKNGYITFASFNNLMKVNQGVKELWVKILEQVPSSRLLVKAKIFADAKFSEEFLGFFESRGINKDRIILETHDSSKEDYLASYNKADIALDPFPFTGATTTNDALWMATPVVTMFGERMSHRSSAMFMHFAGYDELIAQNQDEYLKIAVDLANDSKRLEEYSQSMRGQYAKSPLCDVETYAKDFDKAVREMWQAQLQPKENLLELGNSYLNDREDEKCIEVFKTLLLEDENNIYANWAIAYCLFRLDRLEEVYPYISKCVDSDEQLKFANLILGAYYLDYERDYYKAIEYFKTEISLDKNSPRAYGMIASAYAALGQVDKALEYQRQQVEIYPKQVTAHNNLNMYMHYSPSVSQEEILEAANNFYQNCFPEFNGKEYSFDHLDLNSSKESLRVGFVSGDFKKHSLFYWIEGLMPRLKALGFNLSAFCNNGHDVATEILMEKFDNWHDIKDMKDDEVADLIKKEQIDILLDFSSHSALNRLGVFVRKPCPVQLSWLGFSGPTGLPQMDYLLVDNVLVSEDEDKYYNEKIYRLPNIYAAFQEPEFKLEVEEAPHVKNGYITFGCFNNFMKLNDQVHHAWSQILKQVEGSKLFLKSKIFRQEALKEEIFEKYQSLGIERDRLILEADDRQKLDYLHAFNRVDIGLNSFPLGAATVAHDALWMSTPIVSILGKHMSHKSTAANFIAAGFPELALENVEAYINKAIELAKDQEQIKKYKEGMRAKYLASPVCDMDLFAKDFAEALRSMWTNKNTML